jgi:GTPase SAR1 family protein
MEINQVIPLATLQSHKYLIKFSSFDIAAIPEGVTIPIVNLVIELLDPIEEYNSSSTLFKIASIIEDYIINHNVILYCYCDNVEIKKSEKKKDQVENLWSDKN